MIDWLIDWFIIVRGLASVCGFKLLVYETLCTVNSSGLVRWLCLFIYLVSTHAFKEEVEMSVSLRIY